MQERRCLNCMNPLPPGETSCPLCGQELGAAKNPPYALQPGTVLEGKYLVGTVLSVNSADIAYNGFDLERKQKVLLRELLPSLKKESRKMESSAFVFQGRAFTVIAAAPTKPDPPKSKFLLWLVPVLVAAAVFLGCRFISTGRTVLPAPTLAAPAQTQEVYAMRDVESYDEFISTGRIVLPAPTLAAPAQTQEVYAMRAVESYDEIKSLAMQSYSVEQFAGTPFWEQTKYRRDQVKTVQFHNRMEKIPVSAWDVSEAGNRTVLAWMDGAALHVAANGTISLVHPEYLFAYFTKLESIDWGGCVDTSQATSMYEMFYYCRSLQSLDLSGFDTSKVTDMNSMFGSCSSLTSLDVSGFNTSRAEYMHGMFDGCSSLINLDVSGFDTSKVTTMCLMFGGCSRLTSLDVSSFDTSKVTDMNSMFKCCSSLTSLDVSSFDTSKVTDMNDMFWCCSRLTSLDVSGFNTSRVTKMGFMFGHCSSLTSLDVSGFDTSKVTNMTWMFSKCSSLTSLDISGFDMSKVTNKSDMLTGVPASVKQK